MNKISKYDYMAILLISIFLITGFFVIKWYIQNRESEEISRLFIAILASQLAVFIGIFTLLKDINITENITLKCHYENSSFTPFYLIEFRNRIENDPDQLTIPIGHQLNYGLYIQEYQENKWYPDTINDPIEISSKIYFEILLKKIVDDFVLLSINNWNDLENSSDYKQTLKRNIIDKNFHDINSFKILVEGPSTFTLPKNTKLIIKYDKQFKNATIKFENNFSELTLKLTFQSSGVGLDKLGILYNIPAEQSQSEYITTNFKLDINGKIKKFHSFHPRTKYYRNWIERTISHFNEYDFEKLFGQEKEMELIKGISRLKSK